MRAYFNRLLVGWIDIQVSKPFPELLKKQNYSNMRLLPSCTLQGSGEEREIRFIGCRGLHQTRAFSQRRFGFRRRNSSISYPGNLLQGSLHLIHGKDVARSILAAHRNFDKLEGQRWCLTDLRVYDWWELVSSWTPSARSGEYDVTNNPTLWVKQLMSERGIRALPRPMEQLGRTLDSREFWEVVELTPWVTLHSAVASFA